MDAEPSGSSQPGKRVATGAGAEAGGSQAKKSRSDPYVEVVEEFISLGETLHQGLLGADPNETSQDISILKEKLLNFVFIGDGEDEAEDYQGEEEDGGTDAGSRKTRIDALVLGLRQLKKKSFEETDPWWKEVEEKAKELGVDSDEKMQEWSKVKEDLCESVDLAGLSAKAVTALDALTKLWRGTETVASQLYKKSSNFKDLTCAMKYGALEQAGLDRWDALVYNITTAVVDDIDEDDPDQAGAKEKKTKQEERIRKFRKFVKDITDGGTVSAAKRLQAALNFQSATILLGAKDDTEGDTSETKRPTSKASNKLTFAIAALACEAAIRRALPEAGDWDGSRHQIWWSALRNRNGRGDGFKKKWFSSILNLIKAELPKSEFPSVHGLLEEQKEEIKNLHRRVTDVVGGAKELLDARLLTDYEWCCSDGTYRRITRIVMSNYAQLPTLETWKDLSDDPTWAYDPYGKFVGESIVDGDDPTLETIMIKEMDKDAYHEADLCCFLETDGDCPDGRTRALLLVQNKFTSRHDARWGKGHGGNLVLYANALPGTIQAKLNLDVNGCVLVDAVWSTTSVFAPPPFGKKVWSHSIVDKYMVQKKNFSALTPGSFGVLFGTRDAFEGASGVAPLREGWIADGADGAPQQKPVDLPPRGRQVQAITTLVDPKEGVLAGKPCQAVLPCGFGKTFVSYRVAREIFYQRLTEAGKGKGIKLVVFVTPLQRLCHQALIDWRRYDAVENAFGRNNLVAATSTDPAGILHKSPQEIGAWVKDRLDKTDWEDAASRPLAVFICYHSLESLKEVCASYEDNVFLVCDEAHVAVGPMADGAEGNGKAGNFTGVHRFPSKYRLYQTATPKVHWQNVGEYEEGEKNGIGFVAGDQGGGSQKATYDRKTFACQNDPKGPFGRVAFHATWSECIEEGLLVRPVIRLLDASGLSGLSEEERRVFSNYRVSLTPENAHRLLGLDDCDQEKAAGNEEAETRGCLRDDKVKAGNAYLDQKKTVDKLQKAWDTLKEETETFRRRKGMSDEQKEKIRAEADAKEELTEATRELLRLGKEYRAACSKLDRLVTSQTSVRLFEFLANMLHAIATCPSVRSKKQEERAEHVSHVVSYHTTVARAIHAMGLSFFVAAALINDYHAKAKKAKDDGNTMEEARCREACRRLAELKLGVVSCYQSPQDQEAVIQRFASGECGIIFNVGIMRIGQNVPQINGVAFTDRMSTADAIIQSIGRGLRLYGPEGKQCHVFLPVYGNGDGGDDDDGGDGVDGVVPKPEELLVQDFLSSLSQNEMKELKEIDKKFEKVNEFARRITEVMGGCGPQDRQVIGALCGLAESTGKEKKKNTLGILNPGTIRADVERRRDDGKKKVAGEENQTMKDVLRAGSGEASTAADERDPVFELCMMAMVRCATRTFSGTTSHDMTWMAQWKALQRHLEEEDGKYPVQDHPNGLGKWIMTQRMRKRDGTLKPHRIELLEQLDAGWDWGQEQKERTSISIDVRTQIYEDDGVPAWVATLKDKTPAELDTLSGLIPREWTHEHTLDNGTTEALNMGRDVSFTWRTRARKEEEAKNKPKKSSQPTDGEPNETINGGGPGGTNDRRAVTAQGTTVKTPYQDRLNGLRAVLVGKVDELLSGAADTGEESKKWVAALKRFRGRIPDPFWDELDSSSNEGLDAFCSGGGIGWWVRTWLLWQETPKKKKFQRSVNGIHALTGVSKRISDEQKLMYTRTFEDGSTKPYDMGSCIDQWKIYANKEAKKGLKDTQTMKRLEQVRETLITELKAFVLKLKNKTDGQGEIKDREKTIEAIEGLINSIPEPYYGTKDGKTKRTTITAEEKYNLYTSDDDGEGSIGWWVREKLPGISNAKIRNFKGIPTSGSEHAVTYTDASGNAYNMSNDININWMTKAQNGDATARDRMHGVRVTLLRKLETYLEKLEGTSPRNGEHIAAIKEFIKGVLRKLKTYLEKLEAASPRNEERIAAIKQFIKNVEDKILAESTPA
jgi:superfamily II DNA or RNA helicase